MASCLCGVCWVAAPRQWPQRFSSNPPSRQLLPITEPPTTVTYRQVRVLGCTCNYHWERERQWSEWLGECCRSGSNLHSGSALLCAVGWENSSSSSEESIWPVKSAVMSQSGCLHQGACNSLRRLLRSAIRDWNFTSSMRVCLVSAVQNRRDCSWNMCASCQQRLLFKWDVCCHRQDAIIIACVSSVTVNCLNRVTPTEVVKCCIMSSDVGWHIRGKLWPMPKHGSVNLYVHGNQKAH